MVCSVGCGEMTALPRLQDAGRVSQNVTGEDIGHQKLGAQYIRIEILGADEENFLDEEDVHIFGLRPMEDPLDLVCCKLCKKPIKGSHYVAHAELCKTILSREDISPEPAVNRKPPLKERKKPTQTKKATPVRELRKLEYLNSGDIAAPESHVDEKSKMNSSEAKCNMHLSPTPIMNGLKANPCDMLYSKDGTKVSSKPLKRTASENPSNTGTKNLCKTAFENPPNTDDSAPLATKIYYSQRNHRLRRAISRMFFEEPSEEVSKIRVLQVNEGPAQTSLPSNFYHDQVANQQVQRDDSYSRLAQAPGQIIAARSDCPVGTSGGLVPSMNTASQLPVNDALGSHYSSSSYSFAGKSGNSLGALQQGNGSVPVL